MTAIEELTLPELLEQARTREGLSYKKAADKLGTTDRMYKQWETGYADPKPDKAARIAAFCGITQTDVYVLMGILTPEQGEHLKALDAGNDTGNSGDTIGGAIPGELGNPNEGLLTAA